MSRKPYWEEPFEEVVAKFKRADYKVRQQLLKKQNTLKYKRFAENTLYLSGFEIVFEGDSVYFTDCRL